MTIDPTSEKPIFLQIAEQLEDAIFTGIYPEGEKVPSTNEIAALLAINPHTVLKGMNLLVDEGIIYKKRGLGMFVSDGAVAVIQKVFQRIVKAVEGHNDTHLFVHDIDRRLLEERQHGALATGKVLAGSPVGADRS